MVDIALTPAAARRVTQIAARQQKPSRLRLIVDGGGCAGFQYKFELAENIAENDIEVVQDGVGLVIDAISLPFVSGSVVDYVESLSGSAFEVRNPHAQSSCGCGTSFSI